MIDGALDHPTSSGISVNRPLKANAFGVQAVDSFFFRKEIVYRPTSMSDVDGRYPVSRSQLRVCYRCRPPSDRSCTRWTETTWYELRATSTLARTHISSLAAGSVLSGRLCTAYALRGTEVGRLALPARARAEVRVPFQVQPAESAALLLPSEALRRLRVQGRHCR
eukprot:1553320-Rhodomonas_salina.2